jgi:hypothetical protein
MYQSEAFDPRLLTFCFEFLPDMMRLLDGRMPDQPLHPTTLNIRTYEAAAERASIAPTALEPSGIYRQSHNVGLVLSSGPIYSRVYRDYICHAIGNYCEA